MKRLSLLPLSLLFAASASVAANSVDLRVTGTITPAACDISLIGGDFDLGSIDSGSLNSTQKTALPTPATKDLSIVCSAATLVGIKVVDNRPNLTANFDDDDFGLGQDGAGNDIGWYNIQLLTPTVDAASGSFIRSSDAGATWAGTRPDLLNHNVSSIASWNAGVGTDPVAVTTVLQPIKVTPLIHPENNLDTSADIAIDGSATIELVYL